MFRNHGEATLGCGAKLGLQAGLGLGLALGLAGLGWGLQGWRMGRAREEGRGGGQVSVLVQGFRVSGFGLKVHGIGFRPSISGVGLVGFDLTTWTGF